MDENRIAISQISVAELLADRSGTRIAQMAELAYGAFREPPWNDDHSLPRLHFGLGVDLMRGGALAYLATDRRNDRIAGYILGYQVVRESQGPGDTSLSELSGGRDLDWLFTGDKRVFYGDTLCVHPAYRGRKIAFRLSTTQIEAVRRQGFDYRIGRTSVAMHAMRSLFAKLGFGELAVRDDSHPDRSYWCLKLRP